MHGEDLACGLHPRPADPDLHLAEAGEQRRIEQVDAVRGCDDRDATAALEAVDLREQRREEAIGVLPRAAAARASARVDLVEE